MATMEGYLDIDTGRLGLEQLAKVLGPKQQPPKKPSTLEPYQQVVEQMIEQGIEMTAMWQRLRGLSGKVNLDTKKAKNKVVHDP